MPGTNENEGWHLDKKVPIALIVVLAVYGVTGIYQFAKLESQVEDNRDEIEDVQRELSGRMDRSDTLAGQRYHDIVETLRRIEDKLDEKADK